MGLVRCLQSDKIPPFTIIFKTRLDYNKYLLKVNVCTGNSCTKYKDKIYIF